MKINNDFINKIFNQKIRLKTKNDKIKLSKYSEQIPMYDIYSQMIYPITSDNLHYRLIESHYRFISSEVIQWWKNQLKDLDKDDVIYKKLKTNLEIMENYDIETLLETSYKTLYKFSPKLGMSVSICKRNSFHPYAKHLRPYYTKNELIKLGQNNGLVKKLETRQLIDEKLHYEICKVVSKNDISYDNLEEHTKLIIENNAIDWICYYSFTGSYLFNNFLRNQNDETIDDESLKGLLKISETISKAPAFKKDYYFYRFIEDDSFLKNIKIGGYFIDEGFVSTTRDPFYSPGIKQDFGMILLKITIPKNMKGSGLFIENFSLFPNEQEFLLHPYSKLKLISKDDNFKYYHTNKNFEINIGTKYEFVLDSINYNKIKNIKTKNINIPTIYLEDLSYNSDDRISMIENFINQTNSLKQFKLIIDNLEYIFTYQWFDSSDTYSKLFYNKNKDGMLFTCFEDGYPLISIECTDELVVNYLKKIYYHNKFIEMDKNTSYIASLFAKVFKYPEIKLILDYSYNNITSDDTIFKYNNLYCKTLYDYIKNNKKFTSKGTEYKYGFWKLDKILKKKIPSELNNRLPEILKGMTWKKLIIEIIENNFYLYPRLEQWLDKYEDNLIKESYIIINPQRLLGNKGIKYSIPLEIEYSKDKITSKEYKRIFRNSLRRSQN